MRKMPRKNTKLQKTKVKVKFDRFQQPGHCAVTIKGENE